MRYRAQRWIGVAITASLFVTITACSSEPSEGSSLAFYALGPAGTIGSTQRAIAVGGVVELTVVDEEGEIDIAEVNFEPAGVFEVLGDGNPLAVKALRAGTAELHVVSARGDEDSVTLRAEEPTHVAVSTSPDFGPFSAWVDPALPVEQTSAGIVLLPETTVLLRAALFDADHAPMLGYYRDAVWTTSVDGVVELSFALERQEVVRVTPVPGATGRVTVSLAGQPAAEIEVMDTAVAEQLLVLSEPGSTQPSVEIAVGADGVGFDDTLTLFVLPIDAAGRMIFGVGEQGVRAQVSGNEGVVDTSTLDPAVVLLQALDLGDTTVRIEQLGASLELPVTVRE